MDRKRNYYEDVQLFDSGVIFFWAMALLAFLVTFPLYAPSYYVFLFNIILVHVIMAVGLNILMGYTGQISLGHAGFFAIGAYATALLMAKLQIPFFLALPLAGFIAAFFGFILGLPALRLEGPYLAIASMGFGLTIMHVIGRWEVFGGRMGIHAPPLDLGIPQFGWPLDPGNGSQQVLFDSDHYHFYGHIGPESDENPGGQIFCGHPGQRYRRRSNRHQPDLL